MGLSYYGFAFFIFILLCIFALLCKRLYRGDRKDYVQNMDEKEKKLLALYSTMEDMMDEFNQTALTANDEMARHIKEIHKTKAVERFAMQTAVPSVPAFAYSQNQIPSPAVISPYEDITLTMTPAVSVKDDFVPAFLPETLERSERVLERSARILSLYNQGIDRVNIAKQLAATISEVDLVLGLAAQKK